MQNREKIYEILKQKHNWKPGSAREGADDWSEIVAKIPVGTPVVNKATGQTAVTADGGFYEDYQLAYFEVVDVDGVSESKERWSTEETLAK